MTIKQRSTLSGLLYLSLAIIGPIGFFLLPTPFLEATNSDLYTQAHLGTLGLWFFIELLIIAIEVVLTIQLLRLFQVFNRKLSTWAYIFRMAMIVIMSVNAILLLIVFVDGGTNSVPYFFLHTVGVYIWQLFFVPHVFLIGFLIAKYVPSNWKYLGYALIIGAFGYFLDSIQNLFLPEVVVLANISMVLLLFVMIGEIGSAIALLLRKLIPNKK